jgi:hypothetical protein
MEVDEVSEREWTDDEWNELERVRFETDQEAYNVVANIYGLQGAPLPAPPRIRSEGV